MNVMVEWYRAKRTIAVDALLKNPEWRALCEKALPRVPPCRRQARKYLQGRGAAWRYQAAHREER